MEYNNQNEAPQISSTSQKSKTAEIVVGIIVGVIVIFGMYTYIKNGQKIGENTPTNQQVQEESASQQTPQESQANVEDTTSAIQNDLQEIDANGINSDLENINQQLNNL